MKKEDQVASVEPSKELKELGVRQDSIWYWVQCGEFKDDWAEGFLESKEKMEQYIPIGNYNMSNYICSAHTVAELGGMLPNDYVTYKTLFIPKRTVWCCASPENAIDILYEYAKTEADARAKMLISLIKEGIMKAEEIGK